MVKVKGKRGKSIRSTTKAILGVAALTTGLYTLSVLEPSKIQSHFYSKVDYHVDDKCKALPTIRPSGTYFLDADVKEGPSGNVITPPFKVGSYQGKNIQSHMQGDWTTFQLMQHALKGEEGGLTFDFGANQGFFTYYLATLGMQVHSFEIDKKNFIALQHGAEFNPKEVSDRVHLYPVGLGQKNARFSMSGDEYAGFIEEGKGGPIMGVTFDCFAHHMNGQIDITKTKFVKLDVEGFEIAVLKGMQNSLLKPGTKNIKAMVVEVGPDRWNRASIDLIGGTEEMKKLAGHFKKSFILIRGDGQCPNSLTEGVLKDKKPVSLKHAKPGKVVKKFVVQMDEWAPLLAKMDKNHLDCNFWYEN